jgi:hypothetical protein
MSTTLSDVSTIAPLSGSVPAQAREPMIGAEWPRWLQGGLLGRCRGVLHFPIKGRVPDLPMTLSALSRPLIRRLRKH